MTDTITAVVLAAGAGRRLGELGQRFSKPMVPVAGRPLIGWVLQRLRESGVTRILVVGHPADQALEKFLRDESPDVTLVHQPERRGIANALACALPFLVDESGYLACACDSLFPEENVRLLIRHGRQWPGSAVVGVQELGVEATTSRSAVRLDGDRILAIVEKPKAVDAPSGIVAMPLYWLPREFAPWLAEPSGINAESYVSTALTRFAAHGGMIRACTIDERLEITTADDIESVALRLRSATPAP